MYQEHSSISCSVSCQRIHLRPLGLQMARISLALSLMTSLRTGPLSCFSWYHPQHLVDFWRHHRGSINACCIEFTGFALRGPLFRDWYLMGFPQSESVDHVPGGSVTLFPTLLPCVCPWGLLGNIVLQEAGIIEAVCTASRTALTRPCLGNSGRIYSKDSVICLAAFIHWFSWTLLQLTLFLPNVTH